MPYDLIAFFQAAQSADLILIGIIAGIWLLLVFYNLLFYLRLSIYKVPGSGAATVPVSVIMVERNEEENLKKNLPGWLSLGYPDYEVLIVDDFSEDNSLTSVGLLRLQYPRLKLTGLYQETRYSAKLSRNLALKAASFDNVVFIHPSMEIPDNHWLPGIATALSAQKSIAVGYTRLTPSKGFYHRLYRTESFFQQAESMAYCLNGLPFVANEENIAFKKQAYFNINGFAGKIGEEFLNMELIINDVIRKKNNAVLAAGNLTLQKEMSVEKQDYYDLLHKSFLLKKTLGFKIRNTFRFFNLLKILYLPLLILNIILYPLLWPEWLLLFLIYALLKIIILKRLQNRLNEPKIFITSVIYGMLVPYFKFFTNWRFNYLRKNP